MQSSKRFFPGVPPAARLVRGALLSISLLTTALPAGAGETVAINDLVMAGPSAQSDDIASTARAFYEFWNTGDEALLTRVIASSFIDHTLPPGRPQGPEGPAFASRQFRAAVPDLRVAVEKMIVAGQYVTVHMQFSGHFAGTFGKIQGQGQPISFIATDLIKVEDGLITDNWHIEDNLTLLRQMGLAEIRS